MFATLLTFLVQDGEPVFTYELGEGEAEMINPKRVDTGKIHDIKTTRKARRGTLSVDIKDFVKGSSKVSQVEDF